MLVVRRDALVASVFLLALALIGCGSVGSSPSPTGPLSPLNVITTTTVFADLIRNVGGDRVDVHSLVPAGGEVHTFDPSPSDAAAVSAADLLVLNGLGLDDWLGRFADDAGGGSLPTLALAEGLAEVEYIDDEESGGPNPHLWMNVAYARIYADRIRLNLIQLDPEGQVTYDSNFDRYDSQLEQLDAFVRSGFEAIPADARRVVSLHDAFPYFAAAYGLEVVGVVVEAPGQDPSAADVAALVQAIRDADVSAILSEVQFSDELAQTIAQETGAAVVADLYTDSLGDPPVDTYEGAIRHDVSQIKTALDGD
jgi:ABC-type Zn uptake system ZnuABC Zn-binding protein ZnuA